jgi:hypothetical protein
MKYLIAGILLLSSLAYGRAFVTLGNGAVIPIIGTLGDTLCIYHPMYCPRGFTFKGDFPHRDGDEDDHDKNLLIYPICKEGLVISPGQAKPCYRLEE